MEFEALARDALPSAHFGLSPPEWTMSVLWLAAFASIMRQAGVPGLAGIEHDLLVRAPAQ